jgi:hypothetical protein
MPIISAFYGILIRMYFNDHAPPHFHAMHGNDEALISFNPAQLYRGSLPAKGLKLVLRWADLHPAELEENWQRARTGQALLPIPPLP